MMKLPRYLDFSRMARTAATGSERGQERQLSVVVGTVVQLILTER